MNRGDPGAEWCWRHMTEILVASAPLNDVKQYPPPRETYIIFIPIKKKKLKARVIRACMCLSLSLF